MAIYKGNQKIDGGYPIATSITSSSTNSEVAGAKAVYDLHNEIKLISCTLGTNVDVTVSSWTPSNLPLNLVKMNIGNGFTLQNNTIRVGAGISVVRLELNAIHSRALNDIMIAVYKNDTIIGPTIYFNDGETNTSKYNQNSCIAYTDVVEGDIIRLCSRGQPTSTLKFTADTGLSVVALSETTSTTTNSLNTAQLMNTGSLVGMGDRAELTSLATELTDNNVGEQEITPLETTETKTEGSGDIL